jgi:hypothetical protein
MSTEADRYLEGLKSATDFNTIKSFLHNIKETGLGIKPNWTPEDVIKVKKLADIVIQALPESIKVIKFPNGGQMIFGEKEDKERIVEWDLADIKTFAEHLRKTINFHRLRTP